MLPSIGLGTYKLKGEEVIDSVTNALELGYRHIDTAQMYDNEREVGRAIADSGVPRDDIFLTTKVWTDRFRHDDLIASLHESLERLGTEYVDLVLLHWPSPNGEVPMAESMAALVEAKRQGLTRHIGVSNFTNAQLDEALNLEGGDQIITNQVEVHPFLANRKVVDHCEARGVKVTGYMPLARGRVMEDDTLKAIAEEQNATPAQIALAWVASRDIVVIPSSTRREHLESNMEAMKISLTADEMTRIDELDRGERIANPSFAPEWDE
ncbi:2,5-didehydrogluconate reductase DkgB [Kushneria phosphatilytica]|uniref:2,5-didehydrogluconate reductase DkgB n=1 Tax=Kushneria phosphatilytica TaxID=657387 RepID=A0A1S1NX02_9GAMM|nr:2,5-didehydrogluconate reductase DkgB [Kushneria phosphatilytica]OHV12786.1 2,5-didehydrogluconate reductase B [Kushneria phosphatilytica]QEL10634.1 2,5-didehydrogluconate reductase DkgB [Kushneria phosphatilytica]